MLAQIFSGTAPGLDDDCTRSRHPLDEILEMFTGHFGAASLIKVHCSTPPDYRFLIEFKFRMLSQDVIVFAVTFTLIKL